MKNRTWNLAAASVATGLAALGYLLFITSGAVHAFVIAGLFLVAIIGGLVLG